jgi:TolA-binding protein
MLPLLVILFVVSYCILTMLVFEQGQTIESQRSLIREMMKDSDQLATLKGKLARDDSKRSHDKAPAQEQADQKGAAPGNAAAGAKGSDKETKRPGKSAHSTKEVPGKPAADLEDVRRSTGVI